MLEDVSTVIDACPPCSVLSAACLCFEVDHLFSGQSLLWDQRVTGCSLFLTQKIVVMHWSEPKSYNKLFELFHSCNFDIRGQ